MNRSIVPEIIKSKDIKFFDERNVEITLCEKSEINYIPPFSQPYLYVNRFAKKTTKPSEFVFIDLEELKKLGYYLVSTREGVKWHNHQNVIYKIDSLDNKTPGARKLTYVPQPQKIQKDIPNKRIRLLGPNAGYPHYQAENGGAGPWIYL